MFVLYEGTCARVWRPEANRGALLFLNFYVECEEGPTFIGFHSDAQCLWFNLLDRLFLG